MRALIAFAASAAVLSAQEPIRGFPKSRLVAQHALEEKVRSFPDPVRARNAMKVMSAEPHHAGSPGSKTVAEWALAQMRSYGLDAKIEEFEALLPYPTVRRIEMTAPVKFRARLAEPPMKEDPDSTDKNQLPLYNSYAASGDVTGPLLYVNYGIPDDYERLKKMGIDAKGKIVIARYGQSWRGTKAKTAQEHGALACIIYSDPRDDGFFQGDVFPKGPFRPAASAQRGSVMDMPLYVGDPLSPGFASEKGGKRLKREEAQSLMKIPVLPISHSDAQPLLAQLGGPVAPNEWRGALPITYHVGPGEAVVHMTTDYDWTTKPLYNVIATIPGKELPDEWVLYGNHHDAWVNGAADPVSGAIALLETARSLAELRKTGWQPKRTIVLALWDGEEFGLVGSTEWVEKHRDELQQKAVAYLNSDMNAGGTFSAGGSFVLERFLGEVARDVKDPKSGSSITPGKNEALLSEPGAGSDYVAFVHHAGIPILNLAFNGAGSSGTYHSIHDSFAWFTTQMDKDFIYSRALSQVMATSLLRLSEAPVHPLEFGAVERHARAAVAEMSKRGKALDLKRAEAALDRLKAAAERFETAYATGSEAADRAAAPALVALNRVLSGSERSLTRAEGLPGRPWYKHQLYAPGLYTGYSARMIPAVREPFDLGKVDEAQAGVGELEAALDRLTERVSRAAEMLSGL
ncbi:MAG: M28 family peptidase [Bryobacteraceae bacterium]